MITKVIAEGFKGLSFETPLTQHTLFIGPNGSGKSARTQAIQLAVKGHVHGGPKTNAEILDTYGNGTEMIVEIEVGAYLFGRRFFRGKNGVSQDYRVNGKKSAKDFFVSTMAEAGRPRVIDISAFMGMSDQKKIDVLFDLYPPGADIQKIDLDIEKKKESINTLKAKIKASEAAANRLLESKNALVLPSSTLADVQAEIKKIDGELEIVQAELQNARIKEAADAAKKKAEDAAKVKAQEDKARIEKEAKEKAEAEVKEQEGKRLAEVEAKEAARKKEEDEATQKTEPSPIETQLQKMEGDVEKIKGTFPAMPTEIPKATPPADILESFRAILATIERTGCPACAARLIVKREMRKYQGGESSWTQI